MPLLICRLACVCPHFKLWVAPFVGRTLSCSRTDCSRSFNQFQADIECQHDAAPVDLFGLCHMHDMLCGGSSTYGFEYSKSLQGSVLYELCWANDTAGLCCQFRVRGYSSVRASTRLTDAAFHIQLTRLLSPMPCDKHAFHTLLPGI